MCKAATELNLALSPAEFAKLEAAIRFVTERLKEPMWEEGYLPRLCFPEEDGGVKIGANGLALLMLHEYAGVVSRQGASQDAVAVVPLTVARLENYMLSQAGVDDFVHKRSIRDGKISTFRNDYYTGEALFGVAAAAGCRRRSKDCSKR